uniref:probable receptor-like protein kinase At2g23200 n=1 Tax=Erigeron canadensis TaxID=72917 RepID=UPI001CB9051A|nr:probable receptor-like protein kinase At2g23200 [Erigeron canadensis]
MESTFIHLKIPLQEILRATNNFADENIIGKGGFGNVYKGQVTHRGKLITDIAARRLDRRHGQGNVEFWTEISMLSSLDHYVVEFIGYVDEKNEKIIINRDYNKGSLVMYLSDPKDEYWMPRLSGFEFAIKHPVERRNQIFLCDEAIGTQGYMDPADLKHGGVTNKSDVYSLGVVLFELLCGRKAKDDQDNRLLASLAKFHYRNGTLQDIIDPDLWNQMSPESFKCFSDAAYSCLEEERSQRPNVEQVLSELKKAIDFNIMC